MNKFKLTIDVEKINLEKEAHIRNFSQKIKNLAQHCVNYINSIDNEADCSTIDSHFVPTLPGIVHEKKKINFKFFNAGNSLVIPS